MTNSHWLTVETTSTAIRHCIERVKTMARLIYFITLSRKGQRWANEASRWFGSHLLEGSPGVPPACACSRSFWTAVKYLNFSFFVLRFAMYILYYMLLIWAVPFAIWNSKACLWLIFVSRDRHTWNSVTLTLSFLNICPPNDISIIWAYVLLD